MRVVRWLSIAVLAWLALAGPASAAFPGRDGMLAVQPLRGAGLLLVRADGSGGHRVCTAVTVCGYPGRPQFSPDGRALVFAGPAIRLIATDGSCVNCSFGASPSPAFRLGGRAVTYVSDGRLLEDSIDGLRQRPPAVGVSRVSDAVWSVSGELAVVIRRHVWVGDPGRLRPLGEGSSPDWSPGGSRLVVVRRGWVWVVRVSDGKARRLVRGSAPVFSPDGRWVALIGPKHRVELVRSGGGRVRSPGSVRGKSLDWQPLPPNAQPCVAPEGSVVAASSPQAVLTINSSPEDGAGGFPASAVMGCLAADGLERLLAQATFNSYDELTDYGPASVAGSFGAVVVDTEDQHYGGGSQTLQVFDLRTGKPSGFGGEMACTDAPGCGGIAAVALGASGVSAVIDVGTSASDALDVLCASESLCLAGDSFGRILYSTTPTQGPWHAATGATMNAGGSGGGSCPSVSLCVLASDAIYTSTDPAAGTWTATTFAGNPAAPFFTAVSCPTTSLCVATTGGGNIAVSTNPVGGASAWSFEDIDGDTAMYGISCPSSSECVATDIDGNVLTTTDPTGGPSAWTKHAITNASPPGLAQVTCPTVSLCVAREGSGNLLAVSTDPASSKWTTVSVPGVNAVACPSASLCVTADGDSISYSADPASGNWTSEKVTSAAGYLNSIACPTTTFCVAAGGGHGKVLVSSDPSGGASTWTPVLADQIDCAATPSACDTEQVIASDRTGNHVLDTSAAYEPTTPQLSDLAVDGNTLTWRHSGSPRSAQLTP